MPDKLRNYCFQIFYRRNLSQSGLVYLHQSLDEDGSPILIFGLKNQKKGKVFQADETGLLNCSSGKRLGLVFWISGSFFGKKL